MRALLPAVFPFVRRLAVQLARDWLADFLRSDLAYAEITVKFGTSGDRARRRQSLLDALVGHGASGSAGDGGGDAVQVLRVRPRLVTVNSKV
jgi:hypothetical protein